MRVIPRSQRPHAQGTDGQASHGTPTAHLAGSAIRSIRPVVTTVGAAGTVALAVLGYGGQAWLGLVMVLTYVVAVRWRTAAMALAIPVLTLIPTVGHVALTVPVLAGLAAASLTDLVVRRKAPPRGFTYAGLATVVWFAVVLFFTSANAEATGSQAATTVIVCLEVLLAVVTARGVSGLALVRSSVVTASLVGLIVALTPGEKVYAWRHGGVGLNPNYAGLILAVGIVLAVGLALQHERRIAYACAPGLIAGTVMSQSRGAMVALAVGLALVVLSHVGPPRTARSRIIAGAVAIIVGGSFTLFTILRAGTWAQQSDDQRWGGLGLALKLTFSHPLVGIGWLNFPQFARSDLAVDRLMNTHNDYLRLAAEGGLIAIALWLLFVGSGLRRPTTPLQKTLLGAVVAWATGLLFVNGLATPAVSLAPLLLLGSLAGSRSQLPGAVASLISRTPSTLPRRVVLCVGQLGLGGTERQVVLLAKGLVRKGIDVHVITLRGGARLQDVLDAGARSTVLNDFPEGYRPRGVPMLVSSWRLFRILRREHPDVVHGFLLHTYLLGSIVAKLAEVPVIVTGRRSLGELTGRARVLHLATRLSNSITDAVVANARAVAEASIRAENVPSGKVVTIHNAVPALAPRDATTSPRDAELMVVNVANLKLIKGQAHIIEAAAMLAGDGVRARVRMVGEGPERPVLAQLAETLGVDLELVGHSNDVSRILRSADVYVHASTKEGMSNSIMEAMAVGLPIVATDVGGASELLGDCGTLVRPSDSAALAEALGTIARHRVEADAMGAAARRRVQEGFSETALVTRHLNVYGGLLEEKCAE